MGRDHLQREAKQSSTTETLRDRRSIGHSIVLAAVVLVAIAALVGETASAQAMTKSHSGISTRLISKLVNNYEKHNTFRGLGNGNLPHTPSQGFHLGVALVTFRSTHAGTARDGFVDYGRVARDTDLIAASDGPTRDRFGLVLENASAPTRYSLHVALPAGSKVANEPSGAIRITSPRGSTTLAPATAVDATGRTVPSHYEILHGKLIVEVRDSGVSFPVIVDPVSATYWWGTQAWYSRSDVRNFASWYGWTRVAAYACNWMGPLASLCRAVVGAYTNWIAGTWMYARNTNQCLTMKMTWTGQVIGVNAYSCNWG